MKTKHKKFLGATLALVSLGCCFGGFAFTETEQVEADTSTKTIAEFTAADAVCRTTALPSTEFNGAQVAASNFTYVTDVDTDGDGVVDAATACKVAISPSPIWERIAIDFTNAVKASQVTSISIRYYLHGPSTPAPCGNWDGYDGAAITPKGAGTAWFDFNVTGAWTEFVFEGDEIAKFADASGYIKGLIVEYNTQVAVDGGYFLFDSVVATTTGEEELDTTGAIAEFTATDAVCRTTALPSTEFNGAQIPASNFTYLTDVDMNNDGIVEAATACKVALGASAAWERIAIDFTKVVKASEVSLISIRYYLYMPGTSTPCGNWIGYDGTAITPKGAGTAWFDFNTKNAWTEFVFEGDEIAKFADANGDIKGFIVECNTVAPVEGAYFLFDSVIGTPALRTVTLDNDTANTGINNATVSVDPGEKLDKPVSQIYGYNVEWYADAERTQPFDFDTAITEDITLYGKYTPVVAKDGVIAEFTGGDAKYLALSSVSSMEAQTLVDENCFSTISQANGKDGVLKVVGWGAQWVQFGIQFAAPVAVADVESVTVNYYAHGFNTVYMFVCGAGDYTQDANTDAWTAVPNNVWATKVISGEKLALLADENGMVSSLGFAFGFGEAYSAGAYLLFDSVTYTQTPKYSVAFQADGVSVAEYEKKMGETVVMPEAENKANQVFVGWANGNAIYKAGTEITVAQEVTYTAVYMGFTTADKASARTVAPYGLRFVSYLNVADVNNMLAYDGVAYSIGTVITSNGSTKSVDIAVDKDLIYVSEDNVQYCFNAALVDIKAENLTRIYHAQAYMTVTYSDGATDVIYAIKEGFEGRSYAQVIEAAKNDPAGNNAKVESIYNEIMASKTIVPTIVITVDGVDVNEADYADTLNAYFADKAWKIGETVDISSIVFDGYTVGGTLTGVLTMRGLTLTIALTTI